MKNTLAIFILIFLTACSSEPTEEARTEKVIEPTQIHTGAYENIGENLFRDESGNLYFRTIDRSAINDEREVYARYFDRLYYDTMIEGINIIVDTTLRDVVDPSSFKKTGGEGLITYYRDKNHRYFHREMADGGTLHCTE